ncbi:MAG: glycerol-3-phosphate 1-O-acyltransferase PlsY [Nitrospirae bacterium]|nr:glycerol-3-phosphate 1-O-acyltransferase PlsY [Candidatus Troglogloeales bacterium]
MTGTTSRLIILTIVAYAIGSIPFGVWISRAMSGIDPRQAGSRNMGATNVLRVVGKGPAMLTLAGDILKGIFPVWLAQLFRMEQQSIFLVGFSAILGHLFPVFIMFKGGKGVAVSFGVFLGVAPKIAFISFIIWLCGVTMGRYSSIGALAAFGALPFLALLFKPTPAFVLFSLMVSVLVYFRHKENIFRLVRGEEKPS